MDETAAAPNQGLRRLVRRSVLENVLTIIAFALGLVFVAYGVGLIYPPAGYIVSGLLLSACAVVYATRVAGS